MHPKIYLKPGKDKPLLARHHWVFSGAILKKDPQVVSGGIVDVDSADHKYLGTGCYNEATSIAVRILSFEPTPIDGNFFWDRIFQAWNFRNAYFQGTGTNAYRVLFSEGDFLPGLVIDRYGDGIVIQIQTLGLDNLRDQILEVISMMMKPSFIYEKSAGPAREEEGLPEHNQLHLGKLPEDGIQVEENSIRYKVHIPEGQKTGFFLDQRDNRQLIRSISSGRTVLNCFGYTGSFSVCAALGGAKRTVTVDSSENALSNAKDNFTLNNLDLTTHQFVQADVFAYLRKPPEKFDLVILDPPAFAKKQSSLQAAFRGYKDINLQALKWVKPGGYLITCSCSYHVDADTFQKILFSAASDAGRSVQILRKQPQPLDHPINLFHPETEYLKAFFCRVL